MASRIINFFIDLKNKFFNRSRFSNFEFDDDDECILYSKNQINHHINQQNTIAKNNNIKISNIQKEVIEFANKLESQGHVCVMYLESYPIQIGWCKNEICILSKNK